MLKVKVQAPTAKYTKKVMTDAAKDASKTTVEHWHETYMPGHFTVAGGKKYAYQKRKGDGEAPYKLRAAGSMGAQRRVQNNAYTWRKAREKGHRKPLVWSGDSERGAKQKVRLSTKASRAAGTVTGTAAMTLPRYFYMRRKDHGAPDKPAELTTVTADEVVALTGVYQSKMGSRMSELSKFPKTKRPVR